MAHSTQSRQAQAIAALMGASSVRDASKRSGIPERTLYRYLAEPEFVQALRNAESQVLRDTVRAMAGDMEHNQAIMRAIRDDDGIPVNVRLRAAVAIDEAHRRWREIQDLDERIARLEMAYASKA